MFNIIKESAKNQITEDTIRSYFNAKNIKMLSIEFALDCAYHGKHEEKIKVPFIIKTVGGNESYLPSYTEILFNTSYISKNYTNTIAFCMQVEEYLKEHPFNKASGLQYVLDFIFGSVYIK